MYLAMTQAKVSKPLVVQGLNKKIHSYEGLCYHLYQRPELFVEIIRDEGFYQWLRQNLGLETIADSLNESSTDSMGVMLELLSFCPFIDTLDIEGFKKRFGEYLEAPVHIKYQLKGNKHFARGDYVGAMSWYKSAQAIAYNPEVANNIAIIHMHNNNFEKAIKVLDQAIDISDRMDIKLNKARLLLALNNYDGLIVYLETLRGLSDDGLLWYYYGKGYEGLDKMEEALASYMRCYDLTKSKEAYVCLTILEIMLGHYEQARKHIEHEVMPIDQKAYLLARIHYAKKHYTDYEIGMENAIEQTEDKTDLILELCGYYLENSQVIKAIEYIALVDDKAQKREKVRMMKAQIAHKAGNQKSFDEHVNRLLAIWKSEVRLLAGK